MQTRTGNGAQRRCGGRRRWPAVAGVCIALSASVTAALAGPGPVAAIATYRVVPLSPSTQTASHDINAKGQVVFNEYNSIDEIAGVIEWRAKFYDGKVVRDIGTFGGPTLRPLALNDAGQVAVTSRESATSTVEHAFRWSKETGMIKLAPPGSQGSVASGINSRGWVSGSAMLPGAFPNVTRAFRWTPQTGMVGLGTPETASSGNALNDAGTVVGSSAGHAARWPATSVVALEGGAVPAGQISSLASYATGINSAGQAIGLRRRSDFLSAAALWTPQSKVLDLALARSAAATRINANGLVIGNTYPGGVPKAFVWCPESGLLIFGNNKPTGPGAEASVPGDVNNLGQVVGQGGAGGAFLWTRAEGMVNLNTRIPGAPPDLRLNFATAISENGSIVANSNAGLMLLVPGDSGQRQAPVTGPVQITESPNTNALLSASVNFRDADARDRHQAVWTWGDGSQSVATISPSRTGTGTGGAIFGQHAYTTQGTYVVRLTVTDSSGKSTTVEGRTLVRDQPAPAL